MSGSNVATIASAPADQDVRKRWLLLALALVVGLVAAFAIGSAVKKTSAPAPTASLAQSGSASAQHATITPLTSAGAIPAMHAPPPQAEVQAEDDPRQHVSGVEQQLLGGEHVGVLSADSELGSDPELRAGPELDAHPVGGGGGGGGSTSSGTTGVSHGGGGGAG